MERVSQVEVLHTLKLPSCDPVTLHTCTCTCRTHVQTQPNNSQDIFIKLEARHTLRVAIESPQHFEVNHIPNLPIMCCVSNTHGEV